MALLYLIYQYKNCVKFLNLKDVDILTSESDDNHGHIEVIGITLNDFEFGQYNITSSCNTN